MGLQYQMLRLQARVILVYQISLISLVQIRIPKELIHKENVVPRHHQLAKSLMNYKQIQKTTTLLKPPAQKQNQNVLFKKINQRWFSKTKEGQKYPCNCTINHRRNPRNILR